MSKTMSPSLLVVGCGDLGTALGLTMAARGWTVWGVRRRPDLLPAPIAGVAADVVSGEGLSQLAPLRPTAIVVALTPENASDAAYRQVFVEGSQRIIAALQASPAAVLFVSSTSVYHQNDGGWVDENSPTRPESFSGRRLVEAERLWANSGLRSCSIRLGGLYGPGRDHLLRRLRSGRRSPERPPHSSPHFLPHSPPHYSNRIHRDDAVGLLAHLLGIAAGGGELAERYCGVDSQPAPLAEIERWLAEAMGLEWSRLEIDGVARGGNRRVSNKALLASGYRMLYPSYREGFATMLAL